LKGVILLPVLWIISAKLVPRMVAYAARSQELLLMFALAWCFLVAGALAWLGFGLELGALIAGVMLSGTAFEVEVEGRVRPLRDFFLVTFFILLGTHFHADTLIPMLLPALAFVGVVFFLKPLVVVGILRSLGHHPRTGFLTGTAMGQISEFSFLVLGVGVVAGKVPDSVLSLATTVALATIALSSYIITHNEGVYGRLAPFLKWLEPANPLDTHHRKIRTPRSVLFGVHRVGAVALETVREMGGRYVIVDFNPEVVRELSELGEPVVYGDAGDDSFLASIHAHKAKLVVSTVPDTAVSLALLVYLKSHRFSGTAIVSARTADEAARCYSAGATYVIVPNMLGGHKFRELLQKSGARRKAWEKIARAHQEIEW
jgi:hypothetical protein